MPRKFKEMHVRNILNNYSKLHRVHQNSRLMTFSPPLQHSELLFQNVKILTLKALEFHRIGMFMFNTITVLFNRYDQL